jgi:hypothetical protein
MAGLAFNGPVSILALQQPSVGMSPVWPIRLLDACCQCGACR